jgi:hypothetical protein
MFFKHLTLSVSLALALLLLLSPGSLADGPTGDDAALNTLDTEGVWPKDVPDIWPADYCPPDIDPVYPDYVAGRSYWGRNGYIEYVPGNMPIIISAPHGGDLRPDEIPDRTWGMLIGDPYSIEYAQEVIAYLYQWTGRRPHLIINHLARIKMDANREIGEAAQGNPYAEQAWYEYHGFIQDARDIVTADWGRGHYFDFHINIHSAHWTEIGLGLNGSDLARSDQELNTDYYKNKSHLRSLVATSNVYFPEVVRGQTSLGGYLEQYGYKTVPSPSYPDPDGNDMYYTGYNTYCHGPNLGGTINSTQVETYLGFVQPAVRDAYSHALAQAIYSFMVNHYGFTFQDLSYRVYLPAIRLTD